MSTYYNEKRQIICEILLDLRVTGINDILPNMGMLSFLLDMVPRLESCANGQRRNIFTIQREASHWTEFFRAVGSHASDEYVETFCGITG